jgi:hypothetical protein
MLRGLREKEIRTLSELKIDAYLAFPPHPQELRARGFRNVLVSTAV